MYIYSVKHISLSKIDLIGMCIHEFSSKNYIDLSRRTLLNQQRSADQHNFLYKTRDPTFIFS